MNTMAATRVHIRWMIRRDMEEVLDVERQSFEFPWTEADFVETLKNRNSIGMVAELDEQVVAFMVYELTATTFHILNFAVKPGKLRQGFGTQMIEKLANKLTGQRRTRITLEVREKNIDAQLFFKRCGFRATGVLHDCYDDPPEDAYRMEYQLVIDDEDYLVTR